jgi:hypothetical protein
MIFSRHSNVSMSNFAVPWNLNNQHLEIHVEDHKPCQFIVGHWDFSSDDKLIMRGPEGQQADIATLGVQGIGHDSSVHLHYTEDHKLAWDWRRQSGVSSGFILQIVNWTFASGGIGVGFIPK